MESVYAIMSGNEVKAVYQDSNKAYEYALQALINELGAAEIVRRCDGFTKVKKVLYIYEESL